MDKIVEITFKCNPYDVTLLTALYEVLALPVNWTIEDHLSFISPFSHDAIVCIADEIGDVASSIQAMRDAEGIEPSTSCAFNALAALRPPRD